MKPLNQTPRRFPTTAERTATVRTQYGTILLVEDDQPVRRYLETVLQRAGYQVVTATDGLDALKVALSRPVQAVITDAIMPHLSGHELCRFLRRHPKLAQLPLIMLSGLGGASLMPEITERPDVCLAKPIRAEDLTDCLAGLLRKAA